MANNQNYRLQVSCTGDEITAICAACKIAKTMGESVKVEFGDGTTLLASPDSYHGDLFQIRRLELEIKKLK